MNSTGRVFSVLVVALLVGGCADEANKTPTTTSKSADPSTDAVTSDDADAVRTLTDVKAQTKTNAAGNIVEINLRETSAGDDTLKSLVRLKHVKSLLLNDLPITDEGLSGLVAAEWPLANLDLRGCPVTNDGLKHVTRFSSLKALRLSGSNDKTKVDDSAAGSIAQLTNLKVLAFDKLPLSRDGLKELLPLTQLEELYLAETAVDDDALMLLPQFTNLKKLRLSKNQITDAGLVHLAEITGLTELDLSENSQMSDAGMASLSGLTKLTKLNLWSVPIGNAGVRELTSLTALQWLNLDNTLLSDDGLNALKDMSQLTFLHLGSTQISDTGLPTLSGLTRLKNLIVTRTAVTEVGVTELKKSLAGTEIQLEFRGAIE